MTRVRACGRGRSTCGISSPGLHTDPGGGLKFRLEWLRRQVRATQLRVDMHTCGHRGATQLENAAKVAPATIAAGRIPPRAPRPCASCDRKWSLHPARARTCVRRDLAVPSRRRPLPPRLLLLACLGLLATPMNSQSRAVGSLGLPSQA